MPRVLNAVSVRFESQLPLNTSTARVYASKTCRALVNCIHNVACRAESVNLLVEEYVSGHIHNLREIRSHLASPTRGILQAQCARSVGMRSVRVALRGAQALWRRGRMGETAGRRASRGDGGAC